MAVLQNAGDAAKGDQKGRRGGIANKDATQTEIFKVIKMIMERNFAPVIVFSFSRKESELYAMQMTKLDFNTGKLISITSIIISGEMFTFSCPNVCKILSQKFERIEKISE